MFLLRRKIFNTYKIDHKRSQQIGRFINVIQGDGFDGAVHVTVGDADQPGDNASAGELDGVGIGAGAAVMGGDLVGDLLIVGRVHQAGKEAWIDIGATFNDRAATKLDVATLLLIHGRAVGGVGDIDGNANVGRDAKGAGVCAA